MSNPDVRRAVEYLRAERAAGRWPTERWSRLVDECLRRAGLPSELLHELEVRWLAGLVRVVPMPDRQIWAVPVIQIALHRAQHYAHEFEGNLKRSLIRLT